MVLHFYLAILKFFFNEYVLHFNSLMGYGQLIASGKESQLSLKVWFLIASHNLEEIHTFKNCNGQLKLDLICRRGGEGGGRVGGAGGREKGKKSCVRRQGVC